MQKIITTPASQEYSSWYNKSFYIDKTRIISEISWSLAKWSALFFARPRRWWKSLFISTLKHFFDKELFLEELFIDKNIWNDEELRKRAWTCFTISLDLKPIYDRKTWELDFNKLWRLLLKQLPNDYFLDLTVFFTWEEQKMWFDDKIIFVKKRYSSFWDFLKETIENLSKTNEIFLFIDEYDKPINDCLKLKKNNYFCKEKLEQLKSELYSHLKDIPCVTIITGINKLSMSSFFSDFNNIKDYSYIINLWFSKTEVKNLFEKNRPSYLTEEIFEEVKKWYNWYNFWRSQNEFNPWAIITYLENLKLESYWSKTGQAPDYFRYLITDILKVNNLEGFINILKNNDYNDRIINLDYMNDQNVDIILHYFHYSWLLTITDENKFAIPNNDSLFSFENLIFKSIETNFYLDLRSKSTDAFLNLTKNTSYFKDFVLYLLREKYVNHDKQDLKKLWEQVIISDIYLLMRTYIRIDIRREVNILEWRTDIEYINQNEERLVLEFKVNKGLQSIVQKREWEEQLKRYMSSWKYDKWFLILINLDEVDCEIVTM